MAGNRNTKNNDVTLSKMTERSVAWNWNSMVRYIKLCNVGTEQFQNLSYCVFKKFKLIFERSTQGHTLGGLGVRDPPFDVEFTLYLQI